MLNTELSFSEDLSKMTIHRHLVHIIIEIQFNVVKCWIHDIDMPVVCNTQIYGGSEWDKIKASYVA